MSAGTPGYFETVGTSIVRGRGFLPGEGSSTDPIVVVNETMASTLWPGEDPLIRCIYIGDAADAPCSRVVGVAEDVHRRGIREQPMMQYYVPLGQHTGIAGYQLIVRTGGRATSFIPELRRVLHSVHPGIAYLHIESLQESLEPQVRPWRLGAASFAGSGLLAVLIAAVGLYSVISYSVAHRRAEIGVRIAMGA